MGCPVRPEEQPIFIVMQSVRPDQTEQPPPPIADLLVLIL